MTVALPAAKAAAAVFDRFLASRPPPAATPEPRLPLETRASTRESAAGVPPVLAPDRLARSAPRPVTVPPPGQRERRARAERRHRDRRRVDRGSPYGTERRTGDDDRQADRRGSRVDGQAGIGLTRDYFAQNDARPADVAGTDIPAHLLVRFND